MPDWTEPVIHPITGQRAPAYLHGVIVPMFTPCNGDLTLDEQGIRAYTDYLVNTGCVTALFPRSGLGRMYEFTLDEARRIVEVVVDQAAGRLPVIAGCGGVGGDRPGSSSARERYTRESIELCRHAATQGAVAAVLPLPALFFGRWRDEPSEDDVYAYYQDVAAETNIPLLVYIPPQMTRWFRFGPSFVERIVALPAMKGMKISTAYMPTFTDIALTTLNSDFALVAGDEQAFLFTMMIGGTGVIGQGCSLNPEMLRAVYERMMSLDYPGATRAAFDCIRALKATRGEDAATTGLQYLAYKGVGLKPRTKGGSAPMPIPEEDLAAYARDLDALREPYLRSIVR